MMTDIHAHILPELDDGAADIETALGMLSIAAGNGTDCIVATPHFIKGSYENNTERIYEKCHEIQEAALKNALDIKILPGAEIFLSPEVPALLDQGILCTLNQTSYILVELPMMSVPPYTESVLYELQLRGYHPILAHPERNREIIANPDILYDFIIKGMLLQVNATSLTGLYGSKVKNTARMLLKHNMIHFVASDAHTCNGRSPDLSGARKLVETKAGKETAVRLFETNARAILGNNELEVTDPTYVLNTGKGFSFSYYFTSFLHKH